MLPVDGPAGADDLLSVSDRELILFDLGSGDVFGIAIEASAANSQVLQNDATPIVQSFTFK